MSSLASCLFCTALLPAIQIKKITLSTFPREFLGADTHVFWKGSMRTVLVHFEEGILHQSKNDDWSTNKDGNLDPVPQFSPFFGMGLVGAGGHDFSLVGQTSTDLSNGFGFHFLFRSQTRDGEYRTACPHGHGGPTGQTTGQSTSNKRLEYGKTTIQQTIRIWNR